MKCFLSLLLMYVVFVLFSSRCFNWSLGCRSLFGWCFFGFLCFSFFNLGSILGAVGLALSSSFLNSLT